MAKFLTYTTTNQGAVLFNDVKEWQNNIKANIYQNGRGIILFKEDIKEIPDHAFCNNETLLSIEIPSSILRIGKYAFFRCKNLSKVTLHNGLRIIGSYAFSETFISTISIPQTVVCVECFSFIRCNKLKQIKLKHKDMDVIRIEAYAFAYIPMKHFKFSGYAVYDVSPTALYGTDFWNNWESRSAFTQMMDIKDVKTDYPSES